ncbi:MAG: ABC transporter permease [Chitinophagaceae bacterium]|nr:ABC transporter permease [Chitinophagaceae bacterium]
MIKNYFKIAWRNITKHKFYSVVNIIGLFAGIVFALLIGVYVWQELQVNKNLRNHKRQYLLTTKSKDPNLGYELATFGPLAKRLKEDYPNLVANYYRYDGITSVVSKGDKHLREDIAIGDSTLLPMYGFKALYGDVNTALNKPFSVVITEDKAMKYFGRKDVVGQNISIQSFSGGIHDFSVTAVLKEAPANTVMNLSTSYVNEIFVPVVNLSYFGRNNINDWQNIFIASYIELKENVSVKNLEEPIRKLVQQNANTMLAQNLTVQPVLLSTYYLKKENGVVEKMVYTLSFVGLFILLIAVVNFINIAIASSGNRIKEIGVRKVMGSMRSHLIMQFLAESLLLVLTATTLAAAAYPFVKNLFESMVGKNLPSLTSFPLYFICIPLLLVLLLGLLAGFYPALVLSSLKTVDSIKGKLKTASEKVWLRKSLVGFQFCIALIVLIAAAIVTQQVNHFFGNSLGYNKEYVVASQVPRDWSPAGVQKMRTIRNEFAAMPQVSSVSMSYEIPNGNNGGQPPVYKLGADSTSAISMQALVSDENYLTTYGISMKEGAFFDGRQLDSGKVVLNEKAIAALGYKNSSAAVGQQLRIPGDPTIFTIKGVVNDFHFNSMQQSIQPMIFFNVYNSVVHRFLSFKLKPGNIPSSAEAIQKKWTTLMPGSSFEYIFIDDALKKMYATELQTKKAAYTATGLSLVIALLGVLGLVSLSIHKRVKEIGVRKVLGASLPNIIFLFVKEFVWVMVFAALVACPLAYLLMKEWLNGYAYRINMNAGPFILSISLLAAITLALIGLQTYKAAQTSPAKSLKTE